MGVCVRGRLRQFRPCLRLKPLLSGESSNFEVMGVLFRREKRLLVWFLLLEWLLLLWLWLWRLVGTFWGSGVFEENM